MPKVSAYSIIIYYRMLILCRIQPLRSPLSSLKVKKMINPLFLLEISVSCDEATAGTKTAILQPLISNFEFNFRQYEFTILYLSLKSDSIIYAAFLPFEHTNSISFVQNIFNV